MTLEELIEFRDHMYRDPELLAIYEEGDQNSHWQTRHDHVHGDEVTELAIELRDHIHGIFPDLMDDETREFVIPVAAWLHDIGRAVDIDKHDYEGVKIAKAYLVKHNIPGHLRQQICSIIMHHRAGSVIKNGIKNPAHAIVVIADKCIGDENRVRWDKACKLKLARLVSLKYFGLTWFKRTRKLGQWSLARKNMWFNAPHDRVNFAIKSANLYVDVNENDLEGPPSGSIVLKLKVDETVAPIEEIVSLDWFADSFFACGKAAKHFGFSFRIEFNGVMHWWDKKVRDGKGGWVPVGKCMHVNRGTDCHEDDE